MRILLERGANVNAARTLCGQTPLMYAARWGNAATVRLLLLRGALKHLVTHDGRTACELGADHPLVLVELM